MADFLDDNGCGKSFIGKLTDFRVPKVCDPAGPIVMRGWIGQLKDAPEGFGWRALFGFWPVGGAFSIPDWACAAFGLSPKKDGEGVLRILGMSWYIRFTLGLIYWPLAILDMISAVLIPSGCAGPKMLPYQVCSYVNSIVSKYFGGISKISEKQWDVALNFVCPSIIPSPQTVISATLYAGMTLENCRDWCAMSGWCPVTVDMELATQQFRPSISMLVSLWQRRVVPDEGSLKKALGNAGVMSEDFANYIIKDSYTRPDVGMIWRALHVCRPGRGPANAAYDEDGARADLTALGYSYDWVNRLLYLAKSDLSYRQLLKPYERGEIDRTALLEYLRDDGFTDADSVKLANVFESNREEYLWKQAGGISTSEAVKLAGEGLISRPLFDQYSSAVGMTTDEEQAALGQVRFQQLLETHRLAIAGVKASYDKKEIDAAAAIALMAGYGIEPFAAGQIVQFWTSAEAEKGKEVSASLLCTWANQGIITVDDYASRLSALGYSSADVRALINSCQLRDKQQQQRAQASQARHAEVAKQRAARQAASEKAASDKAAAAADKAANDATDQAKADKLGSQLGEPVKAGAPARDASGRFVKRLKDGLEGARVLTSGVESREKAAAAGTLSADQGPDYDATAGAP